MYNEALNILKIFYDNGYEAYIVGGFVRDRLLGINNDDIDIITNATPKEISNIFNIDINDSYGSIKFKFNNYIYDITTYRKESNYLDNRRPSNLEYINDVKEDLKRRAVGDLIKFKYVDVKNSSLTQNHNLTSLVSIDSGYKFLSWQTLCVSTGWISNFPIYIANPNLVQGNVFWSGTLQTDSDTKVVRCFYYEILK